MAYVARCNTAGAFLISLGGLIDFSIVEQGNLLCGDTQKQALALILDDVQAMLRAESKGVHDAQIFTLQGSHADATSAHKPKRCEQQSQHENEAENRREQRGYIHQLNWLHAFQRRDDVNDAHSKLITHRHNLTLRDYRVIDFHFHGLSHASIQFQHAALG